MDNLKTPFLVNTNVTSFDDYIKSLAKTGKKNYNYVKKHNEDISYSQIEYDSTIIGYFMGLWEEQKIRGKNRKWGFGLDFLDFLHQNGNLMCFAAFKSEDEILSVHFVEKHNNYLECHPPMYDKDKYNDRYLAKYMWFNLINFAINDLEIEWIDLGGGYRGSWKDLLINRKQHPKLNYKWLYIPKEVKENPELQPKYKIKSDTQRYFKYLVEVD